MTLWKSNLMDSDGPAAPALFLDRDGVLIADENYLADPQLVRLLPGVPAALLRARQAGYRLICVSNQSGIGRGYFGQDDFHRVMLRLEEQLASHGVQLDSYHFCPHSPDDDCPCRKPRPGMLVEARRLFQLDLKSSWMIGDKGSDVAFGRQEGMGSVLVRTGYGQSEEEAVRSRWEEDSRVLIAEDLPEAIDLILQQNRQEPRP